MNKLDSMSFAGVAAVLPGVACAVDTASTAYQTGRIVGIVFMVVLALLVIRKLLGK
jgi:hypothetical protein